MKLQTKKEVEYWLNKHNIRNYIINNNLTIDVNGNLELFDQKLKEINVNFNIVNGSVFCSNNQLTSLDGCPVKVGGSFYCDNNLLNTLLYIPMEINGEIGMGNNPKLGKYKNIKTYAELVEAHELYKLEDCLIKQLSDNIIQGKKIKV